MTQEDQYDAIIVGAGFSGIHQLIHLRQLGLRCIVIEKGSDFGGTWYWNRYPGARVDSHIPIYELVLPELWKEWSWTEKFPGWKELQAYFAYVGDKLDLRQHCQFDTVVKQAHWDDQLHLWHVTAEGKEGLYKASARYLILCTVRASNNSPNLITDRLIQGFASKPYMPNIKGRDTFKGPCCHTSRWPKEGIETIGKRVGIIGTGASWRPGDSRNRATGTPRPNISNKHTEKRSFDAHSEQVAHLTVFQRTPNLALPMRQYSVTKQVQDHFRPVYAELYKKLHTTLAGFPNEFIPRPLSSATEKEREATFERLWDLGGFNFPLSNYQDVSLDRASNKIAYEFWRRKVSERIKDAEKRDLLAPEVAPHPIGTKRQSLEQHFYEIFNQDNVDLVDLKATPILEIHENGLKSADKEYEFDVLIFATGFDSYVGGFNDIDLRGLNGETIQDHWKDGVMTYLGLTIDNFPNLFFTYGPHGPTALCNGPTCLQVQGAWIVKTIEYLREHSITKFTPTTHAALMFKKHVDEMCAATLLPQADSWFMGANIPGKRREAYNYVGGVAAYKQEIAAEN
ncbi:cyclohexanone monooxygenase [Lanmaoa asiatica]|nr:cyclohexanone monooxygenase [Lanmaoa asiatica]